MLAHLRFPWPRSAPPPHFKF